MVLPVLKNACVNAQEFWGNYSKKPCTSTFKVLKTASDTVLTGVASYGIFLLSAEILSNVLPHCPAKPICITRLDPEDFDVKDKVIFAVTLGVCTYATGKLVYEKVCSLGHRIFGKPRTD